MVFFFEFVWCNVCASLVFFHLENCVLVWRCFLLKMVFLAGFGAKRGGLEVDVCGVEGGVALGTGRISEEVGTRLVKENCKHKMGH